MLTIHMKCSNCGGSLEDGYEIREHGRDENGYVDEEIICAACIDVERTNAKYSKSPIFSGIFIDGYKPGTVLMIDGDAERTWDFEDAGNTFARLFFRHPERIQIESITYSESAQ